MAIMETLEKTGIHKKVAYLENLRTFVIFKHILAIYALHVHTSCSYESNQHTTKLLSK